MPTSVVCKVWHDGEYKMTGKVIPARGSYVFFHAESGTQRHVKTDSPGGIDLKVLDYLDSAGVRAVHHFNRRTLTLYETYTTVIHALGTQGWWDNRLRLYLPLSYWARGALDYLIPWVDAVRLIN